MTTEIPRTTGGLFMLIAYIALLATDIDSAIPTLLFSTGLLLVMNKRETK